MNLSPKFRLILNLSLATLYVVFSTGYTAAAASVFSFLAGMALVELIVKQRNRSA